MIKSWTMFLGIATRVGQTALLLSLVLAGAVPMAWGQADVQGQWSTLSYTMPINPIHVALLNNGKVVVVSGSGNVLGNTAYKAALWDPQAGTITTQSLSWDMFCNGMATLADGRVFIAGGTTQYDPFHGDLRSAIYDPATNTFTNTQSMAHGRWYPTTTELSDGRILTFSGLNESSSTNNAVEFYTVGSGWSAQFTANWTPPLYPWMHLLPNGNIFYSGASATSRMFNPSTKAWTTVANTNSGALRTYGSSLLLPLTPANGYDPRVMILGGGVPTAIATTEIIDLGAASPAWQFGPDMSQSRVEMDAVLLPTGKVLAVGGSATDENASTASLNADIFDPSAAPPNNVFTSAGANAFARLYHTVALLMPDATVWLAGGNPARGTYESHMEIYKPAYLFTRDGNNNVVPATRPTITSAPSTIHWSTQFSVSTPDAANIASAVLMRPGSSTHAFDMNARMVGLNFTSGSGTLTITGPPNANIAPPGYYMLFLINSNGVPSVAPFVLLNGSATPPPNPTSVTPASGSANGGTPVTITGTGFSAGATVKFGGTSATNVNVAGSTSITATTPAHAAGTVDVVVTNTTDNQTGTLSGGYVYTSSTGGGGIAFVQSTSAPTTFQPSLTTLAATFSVAQTAGNLNIVAVGWGDTTSSVSTVTDSRGNTYSQAGGTTTGSGLRQAIYFAKNIAAGSNTVTVKFNQAAVYPDIRILEYSGLDTSNPLDVTAAGSGTGMTAASASATTTAANELIFGAGSNGDGFSGAGSGFTLRMIDYYGNLGEDKAVSSTGSYNVSAPLQKSTVWVMQMATFRASGQAPPPPPNPTSILPTSGSTSGGTSVAITGTGFGAGAGVKFGGTAATSVSVGSSTSITATTPAHTAGAVDVVVTNTDSQSGTLSSGYTYTTSNPAPSVTSVAPPSGTTAGGTPVTITGTGFLAGATVTLGGTAATGVSVGSSTSITATTPAHTAGAVSVVVKNTDNQTGTLSGGYTYTSGSGGGGIGFVQSNSAPTSFIPSLATVAATFNLAQSAGNLNIVVVGWGDTTSLVSTVADSRGNTYSQAGGTTTGTGLRQAIYYAKNIAAGSNTVTVTFNRAATYPDIRILEYSGLDTSNPLDGTAAGAGTGTTAASASAPTTTANELIFGAGSNGDGFSGAGAGFTLRMIDFYGNLGEDKIVSSTGSYNVSAPLQKSTVWVMQMVELKGQNH
jgi:hypothetical protein